MAILAVALLLGAGLAVTPAGLFTAAELPRVSDLDSVGDTSGVIGLDVVSSVDINSVEKLVNVTNHRGDSVSVTVSLDSSATDVGDLVVDGTNEGDTANFSLASGSTETVKIDVPDDCSLGGRDIPFNTSAEDTGFNFTADRSSQVTSTQGKRSSLAFQAQSDNQLQDIDRDGTVTDFGFSTKGFGPADADYDCDGKVEIPYVDGNSGITIIDVDGETQELVASGVRNDVVLGVGDFDGDGKPAVVYANADDNNHIYRVEHNDDNAEIAGVGADSIAGVADFDDDGDKDIVYTDPDNNLNYYDDGSEKDTGINPSCRKCIGAPKDFDGDGVKRVPFKSQNNGEIMLADDQGNTEEVWNGGDSSMGSLGSFDWNDDGTPDIVMVYNADKKLYWIDYTDGSRNGPIQDSNGNDVKGDSKGVA